MDDRISADLHAEFDVGRGGVDDRHAVAHQALAQPRVQHRARRGEFGAVVDAEDRPVVGGNHGDDATAAPGQQRDRIGKVVLALRIAVVDLRDRVA